MKIWLIHLGELLPIDGDVRLFRYGILAEKLSEQHHHVTRWAPTFVHAHKKQRCLHDKTIDLNPYHRIELLYADGYAHNISWRRIKFHHKITQILAQRMRLESPPDIIVASMPTPGICSIAINYAKRNNIPIVIDVRDLWPDIYLTLIPNKIRWLGRWMLPFAFRTNQQIFQSATAIFAVSNSYLDWALAFARRKQNEADCVFPLGYPELHLSGEEFAQEKRIIVNWGVDPEKLICCFFGQFESSYDLDTVINAARILYNEGNSQVQFVLCGTGSKMSALLQHAKDLPNVIFPGWVSKSTINVLMQMSSIGLVSYTNDALQSLPNKPIEYFAGGLPVLSSLRSELDVILMKEKCGISYNSGDTQMLAHSIKYLLNNPEIRKQMSQNAHQLFKESFSANHVYRTMIKHLEKIINHTSNMA